MGNDRFGPGLLPRGRPPAGELLAGVHSRPSRRRIGRRFDQLHSSIVLGRNQLQEAARLGCWPVSVGYYHRNSHCKCGLNATSPMSMLTCDSAFVA